MKRAFLLLILLLCPAAYAAEPGNGIPVIDLPYERVSAVPGFQDRGAEFAKWLAPTVRIGGGSGTMVYYDGEWMYVLSAGHLFSRGYSSAITLRKTTYNVNIEVFYHGTKKLPKPKVYKAFLLCRVWGTSSSDVYDVSLMRFKPDWPEAASQTRPIAPVDYKLVVGKIYHSCGCDGMSEPAHYAVEYVSERANGNITELVTKKNGPRGGRSGGGVFADDGHLVAVCSRGDGYMGIWTSLNQIHKFLKAEGFEEVLNATPTARKIPVIDRLHADRQYPPEYIPLPGR